MNGIVTERFWDLAQKVMAGNASIAERDELRRLFVDHPALEAEFEELRKDTLLAHEFLPLLDAIDPPLASPPNRAKERVQAKVRLTQSTGQAQSRHDWRLEDLLDAESAQAMETACRQRGFSAHTHIHYWQSGTAEEAQKLTESFFAWLFKNKSRIEWLFQPEKGTLPSFLFVCLRDFFNKQESVGSFASEKRSTDRQELNDPAPQRSVYSKDSSHSLDVLWGRQIMAKPPSDSE